MISPPMIAAYRFCLSSGIKQLLAINKFKILKNIYYKSDTVVNYLQATNYLTKADG
jgi:hypothetical protein